MLKIRPEQIHALGLSRQEEFVGLVVKRMETDYPGPCSSLGQPEVRRIVTAAIAKGESCGIDTEGAVGVLAELMLLYGDDFERSPDRAWAMKILAHSEMPGQLKVRLLRDRMDSRSQGRIIVQQAPIADSKS
jgi:hypothetical protein